MKQRAEMISQSDYVIAAAPLTPDTRGLVGEAEIGAMKPNAVVINVGGGPVIAEAPLVKALQEGKIRGAALDVYDHEPLPADHPFWKLDNVLLSPHSADHTSDWLEQAMQLFVENFGRFAAGTVTRNAVAKTAGSGSIAILACHRRVARR